MNLERLSAKKSIQSSTSPTSENKIGSGGQRGDMVSAGKKKKDPKNPLHEMGFSSESPKKKS